MAAVKKMKKTRKWGFAHLETKGFDDWEQIVEIREGAEHGLTDEQITMYANLEFDALRMREMRLGLENGLTFEQVSVYATAKFNWLQMEEIRLGFENGLTIKQVTMYATPYFNQFQMGEIRLGLQEGLRVEQVAPSLDSGLMRALHHGLRETEMLNKKLNIGASCG